eukprot:SAG11_NODE_7270_length_1168_cov_1.073901_1_plen_88_part_00
MTQGGLDFSFPAAGAYYYAPGAEGSDGKLAVVGALQPNGTAVLIALNTGANDTTYTLYDERMGAGTKGRATVTIPKHSIQTLRWNTK